jgi:lipoate-protein ligase A
MAELPTCRVIFDSPGRGTWNMAVDEALLEEAADHGIMTLRLYQWSEPTLSLGYFQPLSARAQHAASAVCPVVRRPSGGGAILHDRELTYSLAVPGEHRWAKDTQKLYEVVHESVISTLLANLPTDDTLSLTRWGGTSVSSEARAPFLCFERRAAGDVVFRRKDDHSQGHKIVGSAQRRRRGAILQHGSILLHTSRFAPHLHGICSLTNVQWESDGFAACVSKAIVDALRCSPQSFDLASPLAARAERLEVEKHDTAAWLNRR